MPFDHLSIAEEELDTADSLDSYYRLLKHTPVLQLDYLIPAHI